MKINSQSPLVRGGQGVQPADDAARTRSSAAAPAREAGTPAAISHLGQRATDSRQDIDPVRVAELREAIREGRLAIDPARIADRLLESVSELLQGKSGA